MSEQNVIQMPQPEQDLTTLFHEKASELGILFVHAADLAVRKLDEAQNAALDRISAFVPQERLLDLNEAAAYLKFKSRTLDLWTRGKNTRIRFALIGGEKRFRKQWLDDFVERGEVTPRKKESV